MNSFILFVSKMAEIMVDEELQPTKKEKVLFKLSIGVLVFFIMLILIHELHISAVLVGVFQELFTIPMFGLLIVIMVMTTFEFIRRRFEIRSYPFYTIIVLIVTILFMMIFS